MLFKVDENLPALAVEVLRSAGHDAVNVLEQSLGGESDSSIAIVCQRETRAIVTLDLDFADIRSFPPSDYFGIIVLRPTVNNISHLKSLIERFIPLLTVEPLVGRLWVVDEHRVRIRNDAP